MKAEQQRQHNMIRSIRERFFAGGGGSDRRQANVRLQNPSAYLLYNSQMGMSKERRKFLIVNVFDFVLCALLWLFSAVTKPYKNNWLETFLKEINIFEPHFLYESLFDLALIAFFRMLILLFAYAWIKCDHWLPVALTTTVTTLFIGIKIFFFFDKDKGTMQQSLVIIASLCVAWFELWLMPFRVLDREQQRDMLTICYVGQLQGKEEEEKDTVGVHFGRQQLVNNLLNNSITKMCEIAKEKLRENCEQSEGDQKEECYAFTDRIWHGIRFAKDENGNLWMTMSTTERSFPIPRDGFSDDGDLVYVLTTKKRYDAYFSKAIAHGRDNTGGSKIEEQRNRVNVEEDRNLRKLFWGRVRMGARLKHYFGPWALSVDLLPLSDGGKIDLYVIRSECSELDATFLLPIDSAPVLKETESNNKNASRNEDLDAFDYKVNSLTEFRGLVDDDAKKFVIQFNQTESESTLDCVQMLVSFDGENPVGTVKFRRTDETYNNWKPLDSDSEKDVEEKIKFAKGQHFLLKLVFGESDFDVSVNCGPFVKIRRSLFPVFPDHITWIRPGIHGDAKLYGWKNDKSPAKPIAGRHLNIYAPLTAKLTPKMGYLIRAKPIQDWNEISIALSDADKKPILKFIADNNNDKLKLKYNYNYTTRHFAGEKDLGDNTVIKGGHEFEIQFNLKQTHIVVVLDDVEIYALEIAEPEIHHIKIEADFNITANKATLMTPRVFEMKLNYNELHKDILTTTIRGKVKKDAESFIVNIIRKKSRRKNITEDNKCSDLNDDKCELLLHMEIGKSETLLNSLNFGEEKVKEVGHESKSEYKLMPGDGFEIKIKVVAADKFTVEFINNGDQQNSHTVDAQVEDTSGDYLEVKGDVLLFGEPKPGKEDLGTIQ